MGPLEPMSLVPADYDGDGRTDFAACVPRTVSGTSIRAEMTVYFSFAGNDRRCPGAGRL
jgi:hypothetical protein